MLIDGYGRDLSYLRVSLTDKCNLRCRYCVPEEGVARLEHGDILSLEELLRVISIMTSMGIKKVRFTGGEPLVRKNAVSLIGNVASLPSRPKICLTTNGILLRENLRWLYGEGLRDINISIDSLRPSVYEKITGRDELAEVLQSVRDCLDLGIRLKINMVPLKGINEDDIFEIALLAHDNDIAVRFIELMPLGCACSSEGVSNDAIQSRLRGEFGQEMPFSDPGEKGPAYYVRFEGFKGRVGFISPVSHVFCSSCNRLRLTCDGRLILCLSSSRCLDLRSLLRDGRSDDEIKEAIERAVKDKPAHHEFGASAGFKDINMIGIGG